MVHIVEGRYVSPLPGRGYSAATTSLVIHTLFITTAIFAAMSIRQHATAEKLPAAMAQTPSEHLVFIARESPGPVAGGGGAVAGRGVAYRGAAYRGAAYRGAAYRGGYPYRRAAVGAAAVGAAAAGAAAYGAYGAYNNSCYRDAYGNLVCQQY